MTGTTVTPSTASLETAETTEDVLGSLVEQAYDALDFPPGSQPDWQRFHEVFHPAAVLALRVFPGDPSVSVLNLTEYVEAQMRNGLGDEGYSETPGARRIEVVGDVASVRQEFTMNFAEREPVAAVDIFSAARVEGTWTIVSVVSDIGSPKLPKT